jgi:hypothetical protein
VLESEKLLQTFSRDHKLGDIVLKKAWVTKLDVCYTDELPKRTVCKAKISLVNGHVDMEAEIVFDGLEEIVFDGTELKKESGLIKC